MYKLHLGISFFYLFWQTKNPENMIVFEVFRYFIMKLCLILKHVINIHLYVYQS